MLIHAGQELGEAGGDAEGFSTHDGRTSIFDYWSLDSFIDWYSEGAWDLSGARPDTRALRAAYAKILKLAQTDEFCNGRGFGLNAENRKDWSFGHHGRWLFAFLRRVPSTPCAMLVVINLSPSESFDFRLRLPSAALRDDELPNQGQLVVEAMLQEKAPVELPVPEALVRGISMNLGPSQTEVFRLSVRGDS